MQSLNKTIAVFGLVASALVGSASADTYQHIDQLALQIERESRLLVTEVVNYRHTPEYYHLVTDARDMAALASHVHELAHHQGGLAHLQSDVQELDFKFHHLESVFDRIEHDAAFGHGHLHGCTVRVRRLLNSIEGNLHHLQDDLRLLQVPVCTTPPYSAQRIVVPQRSIGTSPRIDRWGGYNAHPQSSGFGHGGNLGPSSFGRGITIGGGSSRFTLRF